MTHWREMGSALAGFLLCCGHWRAASTPTGPVSDDRLQGLVQAASVSDRSTWWPAVRELGTMASGDPGLRDEIWRSAHVNTLGMRFRLVEPGTFTMGPDVHRVFDVERAHSVKITKPFYLAQTEVTNEQVRIILPEYLPNLIYSPYVDSPAVRISWAEAAQFCKRLSEREGATYRLPTEAEWEYACRAGTTTAYSFGTTSERMGEYGWCLGDQKRAAPVAQLKPNNWGLYDMHGNVFEWVGDYFSEDYYAECTKLGIVEDPKGPQTGSTHVLRSCGWQVDNPLACTSTARFPLPLLDKTPFSGEIVGMRDTIGFRIVREASEGGKP